MLVKSLNHRLLVKCDIFGLIERLKQNQERVKLTYQKPSEEKKKITLFENMIMSYRSENHSCMGMGANSPNCLDFNSSAPPPSPHPIIFSKNYIYYILSTEFLLIFANRGTREFPSPPLFAPMCIVYSIIQ